MDKTIITYSLSGKKNALAITRKIYGYTECSNNNKYQYERKGILSDIEYEKLARSCFWINPKDKERVIKELVKLKLKIKAIDIILK